MKDKILKYPIGDKTYSKYDMYLAEQKFFKKGYFLGTFFGILLTIIFFVIL